jgi:hypothetical protein
VKEEWRDIPGFPNYQASDLGNIRWNGKRNNIKRGPTVKSRVDRDGYLMLQVRVEGKSLHRFVHRLVCMAFHGLPPIGHNTNHIDGNKQNNVPSNLQWMTQQENYHHAMANGLVPQVTLTIEQVTEMRTLSTVHGAPHHWLAYCYGVSNETALRVVRGRNWQLLAATHNELIDAKHVARHHRNLSARRGQVDGGGDCSE